MNPSMDRDDTGHVERLLWAAAEFEPDEPAPAGLAYRALIGRRRRRAVRLRRLIAQGACTFACVVAGLLLWPTREGQVGDRAPAVVEPTRAPHPAAGRNHSKPPSGGKVALRPVPPQRIVAPAGEPSTPRRHHWRGQQHGRQADRPRPVWRTEVVRRTTTGVLAPAWVAGPGSGGGMEVTPAVLDVPLNDSDGGPTVGPASYTEENR